MKIQVWGEGFSVTGNYSDATLCGEYEAKNFDEAMDLHQKQYPNVKIDKTVIDWKTVYSNWGCRYYDNEKDARKSFG